MARKGLMEGLPKNISDLEEPCRIFLLTKATQITRGPTTDVSIFSPGFMLKMNFSFFHDESILGFTSIFVFVCSATPYPFVFPYRSKLPPPGVLKFLVTTLRNQGKKIALIRVDENVAIAISSEFVKACHNMNIVVQTTGVYASYINGKS